MGTNISIAALFGRLFYILSTEQLFLNLIQDRGGGVMPPITFLIITLNKNSFYLDILRQYQKSYYA